MISWLVPAAIKNKRNRFLKNRFQKLVEKNGSKKIFEHIYEKNFWGSEESVSGAGSTLEQTAEVRKILPALFKQYDVKSFLDLPCGDFHWMQQVDLDGIEYVGADIVEKMIQMNQARYGSQKKTFKVINLLEDELPEADMMMCRDCFIHLSDNDIFKALGNIKKGKIKYLLTTSYVDRATNTDILTGHFRTLNLLVAPFTTGCVTTFNEICTEKEGELNDKSLILIDLEEYRNKSQI